MPLEKSSSKQAFKRNVSTLMGEVGKSPHIQSRKQALAIAFETQRHSRAPGGPVNGIGPVAGMNMPPAPLPVANGVMPGVPGMGQALQGAPQSGLAGPGAGQVGVPQNTAPAPPSSPMQGSPMGVAGPQPLPPPGMTPQMGLNGFAQGGSIPDLAAGGFHMERGPHFAPKPHLPGGMTKGPILSSVPGRTDAHKTHVPSGSYVIPADIVSGRGQGNTIAGAGALQKLFKMGPYGAGSPELKRGPGLPKAPITKMRADGGAIPEAEEVPVRVNLAGGEIVVPPENLLAAVHPNLETAHSIMDAWVLHERKLLRKTLAGLPGPVRD